LVPWCAAIHWGVMSVLSTSAPSGCCEVGRGGRWRCVWRFEDALLRFSHTQDSNRLDVLK
jgi:hypothetical protein